MPTFITSYMKLAQVNSLLFSGNVRNGANQMLARKVVFVRNDSLQFLDETDSNGVTGNFSITLYGIGGADRVKAVAIPLLSTENAKILDKIAL